MANGGINHGPGILFCAQGSRDTPGGLVHMSPTPPYTTQTLLDNFHGRQFNSLNDVVVHTDGSIWFTDPIYGFEQGFRPEPQLRSQVYRFDPMSGDVRAVADGFGRPNGICFSPDEQTLYVTDTDWIHGDGGTDEGRARAM
jgi:gluconolactonase